MQVLDKTAVLKPIGSRSEAFDGVLKGYSFSKVSTDFLRDLSELPFALDSILYSRHSSESRANNTIFIGNLAERIVGEWLKKHAEYSFQPEAVYIYKSKSGRDIHIPAKAHDYTLLDDGFIFNVEVKFIANGSASRKTNRFQTGTKQLKSTSEMIAAFSSQLDPDLPVIKPENIILVIRRKPGDGQDNEDGSDSRVETLYNKLLTTARNGNDAVQMPRIIFSYKDLIKIFKDLYPQHNPCKIFTPNEECIAELRSFSAKSSYTILSL